MNVKEVLNIATKGLNMHLTYIHSCKSKCIERAKKTKMDPKITWVKLLLCKFFWLLKLV